MTEHKYLVTVLVKDDNGVLFDSVNCTACSVNFRRRVILLLMSSIPDDLIVDILSRLPVKSLLRFRCVSKPWCQLIKNPSFVQMHFQHADENDNRLFLFFENFHSNAYYFVSYNHVLSSNFTKKQEIKYPFMSPTSSLDILGYCNGLYCINVEQILDETEITTITCLWNPSTREYKELPAMPKPLNSFDSYTRQEIVAYGFCYDYNVQDYKFVTVVVRSRTADILIYTLGSNSWRVVSATGLEYIQKWDVTLPAVHVNGAFHWILGDDSILSLDLADEKFWKVPTPDDGQKCDMNIGVLEGCLCVLRDTTMLSSFDVWVMKDYGVRESWTRLFTVTQAPSSGLIINQMRLMKSFKNGELLLRSSFILCKVEVKSVRLLTIHSNVDIYVGSLVSLNSDSYAENQPLLSENISYEDEDKNNEEEEEEDKEDGIEVTNGYFRSKWDVSLSWWTDFPGVPPYVR